jgi:hypothetical protein
VLDSRKESKDSDHFETILQILILRLVIPRTEEPHYDKLTSDTRHSFDYVDAITNLMGYIEVVAAIARGGQNKYLSRGIISYNLPSGELETPSCENAKVRPQYIYLHTMFSIPQIHPATCTHRDGDIQIFPLIVSRIRPPHIFEGGNS